MSIALIKNKNKREESITEKATQRMVKRMIISAEHKYLGLIKTVYYICPEKLAFSKFQGIYALFCN